MKPLTHGPSKFDPSNKPGWKKHISAKYSFSYIIQQSVVSILFIFKYYYF